VAFPALRGTLDRRISQPVPRAARRARL
jgi:hypothetical protein